MKDRLVHWLMQIGIFLLRGAGWATVGVFVGFIVSYFFRLPGRIDTFALTEGPTRYKGVVMSSHDETTDMSHHLPFEAIRRETEDGSEYWSARDLSKILGYTEYGKFKNAIQKAEEACQNSGQALSDHFAHMSVWVREPSAK
ncbi:MAG: hypothetical protein JO202_05100 [Ktedonobacteraceae bacterium]|nr:hypothetical protein [Ktedonobacteraceae bacterium]